MKKHNFLKYVVWQPLYMQTVTSAENGSTEESRFPSPYPILIHPLFVCTS